MKRIRLLSVDKLSLGYRFNKDREAISLIFINYFIILLFGGIVILLHTVNEELMLVSYRYHAIILISLIELWLIKIRWLIMAKLLTLALIPFLLLILPPLAGVFDDEFYFWFPYVPIAISLIPHFILHTARNRYSLISILSVYLLLVLFIDDYLIFLSDGSESIIPIVIENRFYYTLIPTIIFIFVNTTLGLVFAKNYQYEQIMLRQKDELVQAEKMASLGTLTTGIAHEINNPLNFISGSLYALSTLKDDYISLEETLSPEKRSMLDQINKIIDSSFEGVRRATDIITSLKIFANPGEEEKSHHDLDKLLYSIWLTFERRIPYYITLSKSIPPGMQVYCFQEQLQQVISNILENAIEAIGVMKMKENRRIDVTATEIKSGSALFTQITISNNGPAIPEKEIKNVFDPFFSSKDEGKAKGLGMSISYMIMMEHNGSIEAKNVDGLVVFELILPKN